MQRTHCPLCRKEVFYLAHHLHNMTDEFAIEQVRNDFSGWTEYDGLCLPCLERYRKYNLMSLTDIRLTEN